MSTFALGPCNPHTPVTHRWGGGATEPPAPSLENHFNMTEPPAPSLENHFNMDVGDEYSTHPYLNDYLGPDSKPVVTWENSYLKQVITPYIPSADDLNLLAAGQKICTQNFNEATSRHCYTRGWKTSTTSNETPSTLSSGATIFFLPKIMQRVLSTLDERDLRSLIRLSRVSKSAYALAKSHLAAKPDSYWETRLSKRLPHVKFLSSNLCSLSPRQQYEIISYRLDAEIKPFHAKFLQNLKTCKTVKDNLQKIVTEEKEKYEKAHSNVSFGTWLSQSSAYQWNRSQLLSISGEDYNGTGASTFPLATGSKQWQLEHTARKLIPQAFNQEKFEEVIRQSETVGNTTSASSNVMLVESENVDNGSQGANEASSDEDTAQTQSH